MWRENRQSDARPADWAAFRAPDSLVYDAAPAWWCEEACDFSASKGIGAFGDEKGRYCKLPAQILAEGGQCTRLGPRGSSAPIPYTLPAPLLYED